MGKEGKKALNVRSLDQPPRITYRVKEGKSLLHTVLIKETDYQEQKE